MTAQELLEYSHEPYRQELVDGILYEMEPPGAEHGVISLHVGVLLAVHVGSRQLGVVFAAETGFKLTSDPDTVRAPDVAFVAAERVPASGIPQGYWPGPPDLAIEVVSQHDRRPKVAAKAREWVAAGTSAVVVSDPPSRTVTVFLGHDDVRVLHGDETLDLGDVVRGWSPRVADFFV